MMPNNNATASDDVSMESGACGESGVALKKGPWTAAEDAILVEYVKTHGEGNWNAVQKNSGLSRCGKSCRLRWANHLRPNLKKGSFSPDEERLILELHAKLGNKWARMAAQLPGRTDNEIKNYWNTRVKRRQRAGLPLYPHDIQRQAVAFHLHQNHNPRLSPPPPPPRQPSSSQKRKTDYDSPLSLLDPINFSTSSNPLMSHYGTPLLPNSIHRFKQFQNNNSVGFSVPFSPPSSLLSQSLSTHWRPSSSIQFSSGNFDLNPPLILQTPFEPNGIVPPSSAFSMKLELPSSQLPQPAATAAASGTINDYKIIPILGRSNSGLLDAMLLEAQTMAGNEESKRECLLASREKCGLDELFGDALLSGSVFSETATPPLGSASQWDDSTSAHSSIGIKTKKEPAEEINSIEDDLSSLLDIIPSNMSVPAWYGDSGEMSNGQSSGVTDNDIGLEMQQLASSLSVATTTTPEWTMGSCSWDNMPGIC